MAVARSITIDKEQTRPWTAAGVVEAMRAWRRRFPGAES
jgi:hypothetical protein